MALVLKDRVKEQTTTTGTGTVTLGGAVSGFEAFSAVGDGNTTYYAIVHQTADEWEVGLGTYTATGTLLSRDTILESTNSDAAVNFSAGTKDVFVTYPSDKAIYADGSGNVGIGTSSPSVKLELNNGGAGSLVTFTDGVATNFNFSTSGTVGTFGTDAGSTSLALKTAGSERLRIDSSGKVGIGISSGLADLLTVSESPGTAYQIRIDTNGGFTTGNYSGIEFTQSNASRKGEIRLDHTSAGAGNLVFGTSDGASNADRFHIQNTGVWVENAAGPAMLNEAASSTNPTLVPNRAAPTYGIGAASSTAMSLIGGGVETLRWNSTTLLPKVTTQFIDGSATAPSIAFASDTNNGFYLATTDTIGFSTGGSERMRIDSSGDVGIGTTSPDGKLDIATGGSTDVVAALGGTFPAFTYRNGTGTWFHAGKHPSSDYFYIGRGATPTTNVDVVVDSSGNVGIGTSSPTEKLHVNGIVKASGYYIGTDPSYLYQSATDTITLRVGTDGPYMTLGKDLGSSVLGVGNASGALALLTSGTERVRIDSSGNVGIGTTSPNAALDVNGNVELSGAGTADRHIEIGKGRTGNGNSYIDLISDTTYTDYGARFIRYSSGANAYTRLDHRGTGALSMWATDGGAIQFGTNNTERMRINSSGGVGIGTTAPDGNLNVHRTSASNGWIINAQTAGVANDSGFYMDSSNNIEMSVRNGSGTLAASVRSSGVTFFNGGNVGIGTTSPAATIDVDSGSLGTSDGDQLEQARFKSNNGNNSNLRIFTERDGAGTNWNSAFTRIQQRIDATDQGYIQFNGADNLYGISFGKDNTEYMRIENGGNVGIGTTSPGAELDIESTSPDIHLNDSDGVLGGAITSRLIFQASGSTHGNVGFGTGSGNMAVTNNQGPLFLQADTNNAHASSYITFTVDNSSKMRITSAGNVGIGTTSPAKQLEITKSARATITSLTDAASIASNFDTAQNFAVTLGGNRTLANPSNIDPGQTGSIFVVQDGTGGRTLSFGSYWKFAGGTAPTMSTGAAAVDRIDYVVQTSTAIHAVASLNLS